MEGDAYKSYGLWIDDQEVKSVSAALEDDERIAHVIFPLMGVGFFLLPWFIIKLRGSKPKTG